MTSQQRPVYQLISHDLADQLNPRTSLHLVDFSDFIVNYWCKSHDSGAHLKHPIDPHRSLIKGCSLHPRIVAVHNPGTYALRFKGSSAHSRSVCPSKRWVAVGRKGQHTQFDLVLVSLFDLVKIISSSFNTLWQML